MQRGRDGRNKVRPWSANTRPRRSTPARPTRARSTASSAGPTTTRTACWARTRIRTAPWCARCARTPTRWRSLVGGDPQRAHPLVRVHDAGLWSGVVPEAPGDYRLQVRYGDDIAHRRRPVPLAAHARRDRPAPDRRGPPRAAVGRPRRARPHLRHPDGPVDRHQLRGLGADARRACGSPATSTAGPAGRTPMRSLGSSGRLGDLRARASASAPATSSASSAADGVWREKSDPMAFATEVPPSTASVVTALHHEWGDAEWMASARAERGLRASR